MQRLNEDMKQPKLILFYLNENFQLLNDILQLIKNNLTVVKSDLAVAKNDLAVTKNGLTIAKLSFNLANRYLYIDKRPFTTADRRVTIAN